MTNPDREELVKIADDLSFIPSKEDGLVDLGCVTDVERDAIVTALRRLASSDGGVKGEPEPVAWQSMDTAPKGCPSEDVGCRGPSEWFIGQPSRKYRPASPIVVIRRRAWPQGDHWEDNGETYYKPDYFDGWRPLGLYTAPPADAGMREALGKVCIYRAEGDDSIHLLVDGEKIGAFGQHTSKAMALLRLEASLREACIEAALTAPGATTKSDGGGESRPATASGSGPLPVAHSETEEACSAIEPSNGVTSDGRQQEQKRTVGVAPGPSDPSSSRSDRWVCAARQRGITLDPKDCDWPVCGCDPLANKVLDTIAESGFVIVPKDGAPMTDDQIKHMVDRFLMWQLPENFNPDAGISYTRPNWPESWPGPVGTNLFDAAQATAMVHHMLEGLPSTRSEVTVEELARFVDPAAFDDDLNVRHRYCSPLKVEVVQARACEHARALLDQFEIRRK